MSPAALERPAFAWPVIYNSVPARGVEQVDDASGLGNFYGLKMVQVHAALYHPEIEAGDCIEVNFDHNEIRHDGLYMITIRHEDGSHWYGARRFRFKPTVGGCELWGFDIGTASWSPVTRAMRSRLTVYGEIREVFKPVSKLRRASA